VKEFKAFLNSTTERVIQQSLDTYKRANPYRFKNREKYAEIMNEFYQMEALRRFRKRELIEKDIEHNIPLLEDSFCERINIINFMVDWAWTDNPRNLNIGVPTHIPWIPWPDQIGLIDQIYTWYLNSQRGLIDKCRGQGATWIFSMILVQEWRWKNGFMGGCGSNKADNVDKRDDPDCIFEKIRAIIRGLPNWWMPKNFNWKKHDKIGNIVRLDQDGTVLAQIAGQQGVDIGRGGRRSMYFIDEAASLEFPKEADHALSENTDCQIDVSTPKGMNNFGQKRHSGQVGVYTLKWQNNPMLDEEWHAEKTATRSKEIMAQEYNLDYLGSVEGIFIEKKWIDAAVEYELSASGNNQSGLDVAAGGGDLSAYANRIGPALRRLWQGNFDNGTILANNAIEKTTQDKGDVLHYDEIGVGFAVKSAVDSLEHKPKFGIFGLNAGGGCSDIFYPEYERKAKDIFLNARGEWWYILRRRFEKTYEMVHGIATYPHEELISIPDDQTLRTELAGPKRIFTQNGKIKCESKEDMLKRGIKSPNKADAVALAFAPYDGGRKHIVDTHFKTEDPEIIWDNRAFIRRDCLNYGAICQLEDLSINAVGVLWDHTKGHLYIYEELVMDYPDSEEIARKLNHRMRLANFQFEKFLGNKLMFAEDRKSIARSIKKEFKKIQTKQTIKIKEPARYDPMGSLVIINRLIKKGKLTVFRRCKEVALQMSTWRLDHGKMKETGMREGLLMIVSELKKSSRIKEIMSKREYKRTPGTVDPNKPTQAAGFLKH